MIHTNVNRAGWRRRSLALLALTLLAPLASVQAQSWSFKLIHSPAALNKNSPRGETLRMTGGGTFDPTLGLVAASGTYTISNGFDHPVGPVVHGTWHSTGFVSFTPGKGEDGDGKDAMLTITIESDDAVGGGVQTGTMTLAREGVYGPIYAAPEDEYIIYPGGSGGRVRFHEEEEVPFFPPPN